MYITYMGGGIVAASYIYTYIYYIYTYAYINMYISMIYDLISIYQEPKGEVSKPVPGPKKPNK